MKVLITGGPVYGKLDDVKLITNRFKGGLMAELANRLSDYIDIQIVYLTTKDSVIPKKLKPEDIYYHDGFESYKDIVLRMAPEMDAVILGAAIANLIPCETIKGKFPSHNYKEGDIIPINFKIAPRIINQVKQVAPRTKLFGFKLLSNAPHEELIEAAYDIVLGSKAVTVFANDTSNLAMKYAVTKEKSVIPMDMTSMTDYIFKCISDEYYQTKALTSELSGMDPAVNTCSPTYQRFHKYVEMYKEYFTTTNELMFGSISVKALERDREKWPDAFITTPRKKKALGDCISVIYTCHDYLEINTIDGVKASLNTPLIFEIFRRTSAEVVVHLHEMRPNLPIWEYAIPGTKRDAMRYITTSFNIQYHGCYLLFDKEGKLI